MTQCCNDSVLAPAPVPGASCVAAMASDGWTSEVEDVEELEEVEDEGVPWLHIILYYINCTLKMWGIGIPQMLYTQYMGVQVETSSGELKIVRIHCSISKDRRAPGPTMAPAMQPRPKTVPRRLFAPTFPSSSATGSATWLHHTALYDGCSLDPASRSEATPMMEVPAAFKHVRGGKTLPRGGDPPPSDLAQRNSEIHEFLQKKRYKFISSYALESEMNRLYKHVGCIIQCKELWLVTKSWSPWIWMRVFPEILSGGHDAWLILAGNIHDVSFDLSVDTMNRFCENASGNTCHIPCSHHLRNGAPHWGFIRRWTDSYPFGCLGLTNSFGIPGKSQYQLRHPPEICPAWRVGRNASPGFRAVWML